MTKAPVTDVPRPVGHSILLTVGILLGLWFLYEVRSILALVMFSLVVASALYPPVAWLKKRHGLPSSLGVLVFYLTFIAVAGIVGFLIVHTLLDEGQQFLTQLPQYSLSIKGWLRNLPEPLASASVMTSDQISDLAQQGVGFVTSTIDYLRTFFGGILGLITVLILTYYLLVDIQHFEHLALLVLPNNRKKTVHRVLSEAALKTGSYVRGQLFLMVIMGTFIGVCLSLLGIKYAFLLGVIAFALDAIPMVGATVSVVIGTVVTLAQDPGLAPWVLLIYFGSQQLENYVLVPRVMSAAVELKPFWILLAILVGASLGGVVGTLLAIPTAVLLHLLIDEFYIRGALGKDPRKIETVE